MQVLFLFFLIYPKGRKWGGGFRELKAGESWVAPSEQK